MKIPFFTLFLFCYTLISAQDSQHSVQNDSLKNVLLMYEMPVVNVLGEKPRLMSGVPGSATFINTQKIENLQALSGNEVFRTVPGVHVVDEEGLGLRANIGIRGLDPDRSSKILVLEDGIPVSLNPYGEPQLYYTPTMDRMESVEVLKGSGQILFGPQTIGGVINYISADPPKQSEGRVKLMGGQGNLFSGLLSYGNTVGNTGYHVTYLRKQADEIGPTNFTINNLVGKINFALSNKSKIGLKLGFYDELSNSTYVGLTQPMYEAGGMDYQVLAPDDELDVRRISTSIVHEYKWNEKLKLNTSAFAYSTARNWRRQDFSYAPTSNMTGVIWGDTTIANGAIYMRDQNGHRNRQFEVAGVESRLSARYQVGNLSNKLDAGIRYMFERAFEQRVNGRKSDAASGSLISDEIRTGRSFSLFLQNRIEINQSINLTAGVRSEFYDYQRDIIRANQIDTSIVSNDLATQLIPGIGIDYTLNNSLVIFGGIHRGFAPPRVQDAIAVNGVVYNLDPELSWNSEIGLRANIKELLTFEITGFHMDFSNQVIPISESSGGSGSGVVNGGNTLHQGVEFGFDLQAGKLFLPESYTLGWSGSFTYVDAFYNKDRFKDINGEAINIKDNRTPYSPELLLSSTIYTVMPFGLSFNLTGNYIGEQFTDELNTVIPSGNGQTGLIDAYFTLDGNLQYLAKKIDTRFIFAVKNITDNRNIVSRRPQGIRVGLPRFISFGMETRF